MDNCLNMIGPFSQISSTNNINEKKEFTGSPPSSPLMIEELDLSNFNYETSYKTKKSSKLTRRKSRFFPSGKTIKPPEESLFGDNINIFY